MNWKDVWLRKGSNAPAEPTIPDLMKLNGYDSVASSAGFDALDGFSARVGARLNIKPDMRLLEVGCGSGAWLRHHYLNGVNVSGADFSHDHLRVAGRIMPSGNFTAADATSLPYGNGVFDIAVGGSCFQYLPDAHSASDALSELIRVLKPGCRGAVTDLPDVVSRTESETFRRGELGHKEYERRYSGLDHQHFSRQKMISLSNRLGCSATTTTQEIIGYGNSPYRFNLWIEKET
jgi:ubiquinone/menaquinone biosynthesis C-methylase UbiE